MSSNSYPEKYGKHDLTAKYSGAQSSWSITGTKQLWPLAATGLLYFLNCNQCHTNFSEGRDVLFYFRSVKQKQTIAVNLRALKRHLTEPYPVLIVWESTVLAQLAYWANSL